MKKLLITFTALVAMNFTACKKDYPPTPIKYNADILSLIKAVNNSAVTVNDWKYVEKLKNDTAGSLESSRGIAAPIQMGQGGGITGWLPAAYTANIFSYYEYCPHVNVPALGIMEIKYSKNGVLKTMNVLKVIQPMPMPDQIDWLSAYGVMIDYGTQFFVKSWGISISGNMSYISDTFGPYYYPATATNQMVEFGKHFQTSAKAKSRMVINE